MSQRWPGDPSASKVRAVRALVAITVLVPLLLSCSLFIAGDSLSACIRGPGNCSRNVWPAYTARSFVATSLGGRTCREIWETGVRGRRIKEPYTIVFCGANDAVRWVVKGSSAPEETRQYARQIGLYARIQGSEPIFVTPPSFHPDAEKKFAGLEEASSDVARVIREAAQSMDAQLVDAHAIYLRLPDRGRSLYLDFIHQNEEGARFLASLIEAEVPFAAPPRWILWCPG